MTVATPQCIDCEMNQEECLQPVGREQLPDILFIKDKPSREDIRYSEAYDDKGGKLIRQIIATLKYNPGRCRYTCACLCGSIDKNLPKIKDINACKPRLIQEIRKTKPKIIVTLGKTALTALMRSGKFDEERGRYRTWEGIGVIPTIDPNKVPSDPDLFLDLVTDIEYALKIAVEGDAPTIDLPTDRYYFVDTQDRFDKLIKFMKKKQFPETSVDLETSGVDFRNDEIFSISLTFRHNEAYIIDWYNLIRGNKKNFTKLDQALKDTGCVYWNSMFDHLWLRYRGMEPNFVQDVMLSHYALDERQGTHRLKRVANDIYHVYQYEIELEDTVRNRRLERKSGDHKSNIPPFSIEDWKDTESRKAIAIYNGADSDLTFRINESLKNELIADSVDTVPKNILIPAAKHFIQLKLDGVKIDKKYHDSLGETWKKKISECEERLQKDMGDKPFNLDSNKQLNDFLFNTLNLTPMKSNSRDGMLSQEEVMDEISKIDTPEAQEYWHTASAAVFTRMKPKSTSMFMLFWLAEQHPFARTLVDYRWTSKRYDTYYVGLNKLMDEDYRIRPDIYLHGTRTGRLSSHNPNVHGTPRDKAIKRMYMSDPGYSIIDADYSQAEIRMMAHFSKDVKLIQALYELDIHTEISKVLFNMTDKDMESLSTEEIAIRRRAAKTIAFGLIYGRGHKSLATQMNVSEEEALSFISRYFSMMPRVRSWINQQHDYVLKHHEVSSLYGRKRRFPYIPDKKAASKAKRQAVNMPIQSSVSDMTLLANIDIVAECRRRKMNPRVGFHIHDGFFFQVPDECVDEALEITMKRMNNVGFATDVPFIADVGFGKTWGDIKKVPTN